MRVLLVEDDEPVAQSLRRGLLRYGFEVEWVTTGGAALSHSEPYDVVLLDLGLPDTDGLDVCKALRERGDVPIIVISARSDETDRVVGLELGADDYVSKPFGVREVIARIQGGDAPRPAAYARGRAAGPDRYGPRLTIDRKAARVRLDGEQVALAPKEYDLLGLPHRGAGRADVARADHGSGLGRELVRADEDARRARGGAAAEAGRGDHDRGGTRGRLPPGDRPRRGGAGVMIRQLIAATCCSSRSPSCPFTVPVAVHAHRASCAGTPRLSVRREATTMALLLGNGDAASRDALAQMAKAYADETDSAVQASTPTAAAVPGLAAARGGRGRDAGP